MLFWIIGQKNVYEAFLGIFLSTMAIFDLCISEILLSANICHHLSMYIVRNSLWLGIWWRVVIGARCPHFIACDSLLFCISQWMASGVLGLHGLPALSPVEEEFVRGLGSVTVQSHSMGESHAWEIPSNMICAIRRIAQLVGIHSLFCLRSYYCCYLFEE